MKRSTAHKPLSEKPSARRMRSHRERRRDGLRCIVIEVRDSEIEAFKKIGYIPVGEERNRNALRKALYRFLDEALIEP